jgi:hypothetical protein
MQITKKRKKWLRKEISHKPLKIRKIKKGIQKMPFLLWKEGCR